MKLVKLFLLLMCVMFLCGCNVKDYRTTITFASWGSKTEIDILKPLLEDFENKNPDIKVDFMHIPQNYFQKIHLLFASNTAPDVIFINNLYLPIYANAGVLEELQANKGFYPQALDALSFNGKLYAIPRDVSNLVIFYNKDMFDAKGISYPSNGWNFEEFLTDAKKLSGNGKFGISFEEEPLFYLPYLMSEGGGILPDEINKPESQKALKFYADLRNKYHVAPLKSESGSATMAQMFLQERIGMYLSGRWLVPKIKDEAKFRWDIVEFPTGSKGSVVPLDASGWAVSKSSKHKSEALRLVNYLSSEESLEHFAKSGLITPARKNVAEKYAKSDLPENLDVFIKIITTSKPTPVTVDYREIIDKLKKNTELLFM